MAADIHMSTGYAKENNIEFKNSSIDFTNKNDKSIEVNNLTKFTGFYDNRYVDPLVDGYALVFITKPMLFIDPVKPNESSVSYLAYRNMEQDPYFAQFLGTEVLNIIDFNIVKLLSYNDKYKTTSYLPIFTNNCKSFDNPGMQIKTTNIQMTKQGYQFILPTFTTESNAASPISISLPETQNLDVTKILSLWVRYMENIFDGTFSANPTMIKNRMLDYTSSIFYFFLEPDGKTLKYWIKYTGCYPTDIPSDQLNYGRGSSNVVNITAKFNYTVKEEMNPDILKEFNLISLNLKGIDEMSVDNTEGHSAITQSKFLTKTGLTELAPDLVHSEERDPLIYFSESSKAGLFEADETSKKFEISFAPGSRIRSFQNKSFGTEYFMDLDEFDKVFSEEG